MKMLLIFSLLILTISGFSQDLIIYNINIIDVVNNKIDSNRTIVISKGMIEKITTGSIKPKNQTIINGKDKFIIPGLWDMHTHPNERDLALFIINGVTGIRI